LRNPKGFISSKEMARITDVQKITEIIATAKIVFLLAEMN